MYYTGIFHQVLTELVISCCSSHLKIYEDLGLYSDFISKTAQATQGLVCLSFVSSRLSSFVFVLLALLNSEAADCWAKQRFVRPIYAITANAYSGTRLYQTRANGMNLYIELFDHENALTSMHRKIRGYIEQKQSETSYISNIGQRETPQELSFP